MPSHSHTISNNGNTNLPITINAASNAGTGYSIQYKYGSADTPKLIADNIGSNQSHNNLQPCYTCYIWLRTA